MKNRAFGIGLLSLLAVSCSLNEIAPLGNDLSVSGGEFYAIIDEQPEADTKVYADENLKVLWNEDDRMSIFNLNTFNQEYKFLGDDGDNAGAIVRVDDTAGSGDPLEHIYAVYPYVESTAIDASGTLSFTLPSEQSYHEKSFGIGANTMVSVTDDIKLRFKNVGGYLSLKFYGEGVSVSSIVLKGNNGELLSGPCSIVTSSGIPAVTMSSGASDQVTLVCDPPVELGATSSEAVQFIFVLPPVTLTEGFTVTVTTPEGAVFEKSSSNKYEIGRSAITKMGSMKVLPELPGNIVFADQTVKSICVKYWDTDNDGGLSYEEAAAVKSLMVDASLTKAGEEVSAFAGTGITTFDELVYFTGLETIEAGAFEGCTGLKSVTISDQVSEIGDNAFNGCQNLESITLTSPTPPEIGANVFDNTNDCPIYVPEEAIEAYQSEWSEHLDYVGRIVGAILPENFPDEIFRSYVFKNFDTNKDGVLSEEECDEVTEINVNHLVQNIHSLEGIDYFRNLSVLACQVEFYYATVSGGSHNWHLMNENDEEVIGGLTSLDVSSNHLLENLYCAGNQLTSVILSGNSSLNRLDLGYNHITAIDLNACPLLTYLDISENEVGTLDLSNNPLIERLYCAGNYNLSILDLSLNPELNFLVCNNCSLSTLNVADCPKLTHVQAGGNKLTTIDVGNLKDLEFLSVEYNRLGSLDVSANDSLSYLGCNENSIDCLYLSFGQAISTLRKDGATLIVYKGSGPAADEIWYTSVIGVVEPCSWGGGFGEASIVSNTYEDGKGIIKFDRPLTSIGTSAFAECRFQTVMLPEGLTKIDSYAFGYCESMSSISLPSTLASIGFHALRDCYSLTSIAIPESVATLEGGAFDNCRSLESFYGKFASADHRWLIVDGEAIAVAPKGITECVIPSGVTGLGPYLFHFCSNITSVTIPEGVTDIGSSAFAGCSSLTTVIIPESMAEIESGAFSQCYSMVSFNGKFASEDGRCLVVDGATVGFAPYGVKDYTVPSIVTNIAYSTFSNCSSLRSITVPASVTRIGEYAFKGCSSLQSITFDSATPPTLNSIQVPTAVFDNTNNCPLYVPASSVEAYKHMQENTTWGGWARYADRIQPRAAIPEAVDLGLSVKWASFNLGATAPETQGESYALGETQPYSSQAHYQNWKQGKEAGYAWSSYSFNPSADGETFTKYTGSDYSTLQPCDDAAAVNLGGGWRIPTLEEFEELLNPDNCSWEFIEGDGSSWLPVGWVVTSKIPGYTDKSIFLPPAVGNVGNNGGMGGYGFYWTSALTRQVVNAYCVSLYNYWFLDQSFDDRNSARRSNGLRIRPVIDK